MDSSQIFSKYEDSVIKENIIDEGTLNGTYELYNKINFDEIPNKTLYDKIDEYKTQIVKINKKLKAYEKIINEQKNKIRLIETNVAKLEEDNSNCNNIINIQTDVIVKLRGINSTLYDHIKNK